MGNIRCIKCIAGGVFANPTPSFFFFLFFFFFFFKKNYYIMNRFICHEHVYVYFSELYSTTIYPPAKTESQTCVNYYYKKKIQKKKLNH